MADVINLRRARKEKARREQSNEAQANRLRFGRTKGQKAADVMEEKRREAVDRKRLDQQSEPTDK